MSRAATARDRAAEWIVARGEPGWSDADAAALDAWLAEADMNRIAFLRLDHSWREAGRINALGPLPAPAPHDVDTPDEGAAVVPMRPRHEPLSRRVASWIPAGIAASLALAVGVATFDRVPDRPVAAARFDTRVGGHKVVMLADGSSMELNTASTARAVIRPDSRTVWLDDGEAYFEVAHDAGRPFVVHAGDRRVTVLGTKFSVRREGEKISVFVREGRVRVDDTDDAAGARSTTITANDIAFSRGEETLITAKARDRVEGALAWRDGMIRLDRQPLARVAAEFNRYNRQQIVVAPSVPDDFRVGGTFPAARPGDFARLLRDAYGLKVEETPEEIRLSL